MKKFFSSKLNLALTILLLVLIICASLLLLDFTKKDVEAPDFANYTVTQIEDWAKDNGVEDKLKISYEFNENIDENKVFYQSVSAGEKIEDAIEIIISKGKDPNAPLTLIELTDSTNKTQLESWFNSNGFTNVKYLYTLNEKPLDTVISMDKSGQVRRDEEIIVTVSCFDDQSLVTILVPDFSSLTKEDISIWASGYNVTVNYTYEAKENVAKDSFVSQNPVANTVIHTGDSVNIILAGEKQEEEKPNSNSVTVPDDYLFYTEANFKQAIEKLGLVPTKSDTTYKSEGHDSGTIYSYQSSSDGITFNKGDKVIYYLVDNGDVTIVNVPDTYLGYSEADFIKAIEALGLKASKQSKTYTSQKYKQGCIYAYDSSSDGITFKKGDTVKYYLVDNGGGSTSGGGTTPTPEPKEKITLSNLVGKTKAEANSYCTNNGLTFNFTESSSSSVAAGNVISMSPASGTQVEKGSTVTFVISKGVASADIADADMLIDYYSDVNNYDGACSKIKSYFTNKGFTNVTVNGVSSSKSVGVITSVSVNGNTTYSEGSYPLNTPIIIEICQTRLN